MLKIVPYGGALKKYDVGRCWSRNFWLRNESAPAFLSEQVWNTIHHNAVLTFLQFNLRILTIRRLLIIERCTSINGMDYPAFAFLFIIEYAIVWFLCVNMIIVETSEQARFFLESFYNIVEIIHHHIIILCTINRHTTLSHVGRELVDEFVQCLDILSDFPIQISGNGGTNSLQHYRNGFHFVP